MFTFLTIDATDANNPFFGGTLDGTNPATGSTTTLYITAEVLDSASINTVASADSTTFSLRLLDASACVGNAISAPASGSIYSYYVG